ncbi:MAG TPA: hypothetical protein VHP58_06735 [Alphaproteobacteria bacterium]|nr:hypothetical protein [Alphaproteobacteria bacterium]
MTEQPTGTLPDHRRLGIALTYLTHADIEVLAEMMVSADVMNDETNGVGRRIRDMRDVRHVVETGKLDGETLRLMELQLLPRIGHAGYGSLQKMMQAIGDDGQVKALAPLPWQPGQPLEPAPVAKEAHLKLVHSSPGKPKAKAKAKAPPKKKRKKAVKAKGRRKH